MNQAALFAPMFCLFFITALVWILLIGRRLVFFRASAIDTQLLITRQAMNAQSPARILALSNHLVNLFELPVIFYVLTLVVAFTGTVDEWFMRGAWAFVGLRALHSVVHCTYNKLPHRFAAYALSSLVLWALVIKTALQLSVF